MPLGAGILSDPVEGGRRGGRTVQLAIDRSGAQPIYRQIADAIRGALQRGEIPPGTRLASTRALARQLSVHRQTIVEAYRLLGSEGRLRSGVGAGTFVEVPASPRPGRDDAGARPFSWRGLLRDPRLLDEDPTRVLSTSGLRLPRNAIQLAGAIPDRRQFPLADFAACVEEVLAGADSSLLDYAPPEGDEPLRRWVVEWLGRAGVRGLDEGRVVILSGSQQGLDLLGRLLLSAGEAVATEAPTYTGAFMALRHAGARIVTVPMEERGLSLDALETLLDREPVKFLYTMPCFQNPTGITLGERERERLLALARRRRLAIVEDHYDSDLHISGEPPRPLLADDQGGQIVYLGTFSKMLFPGVRVGWMIAPAELIDAVRQLRRAMDLASATLTQSAMARFCRHGHLERHLARVRRLNGQRLRAMLQALDEHFPPGAVWTRPRGGMTLWAEAPEGIDTLDLFHAAAARGVVFSPGTAFFPNGGGRRGMRLSFVRESEARIRRGVRILGELMSERLRGRRGEGTALDDATPPV
ncbi:MAG: PLP-dependent aminotransferase family protein [Candidatus Eisenbacteria bacterium]|uniref:PLP-dependent aminotransferase family protein n=1 Tax=Eiseniibacteriota bacterium TaxID=2212470 RepID=A0A937X9Y4_UNCEI|nr:PLP-dependent aminotransferase family protein [Candidatus Eisenbacteria bacterium]